MAVCAQCGRDLAPAGADAVCPECQAAGAAPSVPETSAQPRTRVPLLSAASVLVALNVLVFVAMLARGVPPMRPNVEQLLRWGANFGPLTLDRQWWRLVSAMFVHIGLLHLALNMWCLWDLGLLAEYLYGQRAFVAVYLLAGVTGSIVSVAYHPAVVSAGASGAIFGVAGALISTLYLAHIPAPRRALRTSLISLLVFAGYNLAYGFVKGGIDNGAHVGGLVAGLLLGAVLSRDFPRRAERRSHLRGVLFPLFAVLLVAGFFAVRHFRYDIVPVYRVEELLRKGDTKGAVAEANRMVQTRPDYAAWYTLGTVQLRDNQPAAAEAAFLRAAQLQPKDIAARGQLGVLYLRTRRFEPARVMFAQITQLDPKNADAYIKLGFALNQLGRAEEAATSYRKAVTIDPKLTVGYYNLGLTSMDLKRYADAVSAFTEATRLNPNDPEAWIWLANAYQANGQTTQADTAYLKAYQLRARLQQQQRQQRRR